MNFVVIHAEGILTLYKNMFVVGTLNDLKPLSQYIVCQPWLSSSVDCLGYVGGHE